YSLGLNDLTISAMELTVHVGDSALLGCVSQSTGEKHVTKVDWLFSSGEHVKDEYVLYYYSNISVPLGRFQNRVRLVGDILHHDGSLLLQNVEETDQGNFTCEIRFQMESLVFKKVIVLHVLPEEPKELMVHVGDSTQMGCVFHSTEEKHMSRVDWMFSSGEPAKEEIVLRYQPKLRASMGRPQNWGRFLNRVNLVGDTSRNDGSMMLHGVKESDGGNYTCSIYLGNLTFRKTTVLQVILKESRTLVTPGVLRPEILGGNQLVIIVGIVCATILLLPVLILIVKRAFGNKRSSGMNTSVSLVLAGPYPSVYPTIDELFLQNDEIESRGVPLLIHLQLNSLVAQLVKNPPAMRETWVRSLGWEDTPEKGKATHSSILA
ncbi:hypothetical protein FD754_011986, partial [Muntiacus muntjak]